MSEPGVRSRTTTASLNGVKRPTGTNLNLTTRGQIPGQKKKKKENAVKKATANLASLTTLETNPSGNAETMMTIKTLTKEAMALAHNPAGAIALTLKMYDDAAASKPEK